MKTYVGNTKNYHVEASYNQKNQPAIEKPATSKYLDIIWQPNDPTINSHELVVEIVPPDNLAGISGNRIVDLSHVLQWAFKLERHRSLCKGSSILFVEEIKNGFNSIFVFKCSMCMKEFRNCNENTEKLNEAYVWGTLTAGSYYTQAAHITNVMDIPTISASKFRKVEKLLGNVWRDHLTDIIKKNGEMEKAIAIEKNHVDEDGVPHVTVYVDGGWPKRSYGHDYSSASGMVSYLSLHYYLNTFSFFF